MRVALYTTLYPASRRYWDAFFTSVVQQTNRNFSMWIGADALDADDVAQAVADYNLPSVRFVTGNGPVDVRCRAIRNAAAMADVIILVDSDDVLFDCRVASAIDQIQKADVTACALQLIDGNGNDLGLVFGDSVRDDPSARIPCVNAFGFSNSTYRCDIISRCLPDTLVPDAASVFPLDWFVATCAWLRGARFAFDAAPRMAYRQHGSNDAGVLPPFDEERIRRDIGRVIQHYNNVLLATDSSMRADRVKRIQLERERLLKISDAVACGRPAFIKAAIDKGALPLWWEWVTSLHVISEGSDPNE